MTNRRSGAPAISVTLTVGLVAVAVLAACAGPLGPDDEAWLSAGEPANAAVVEVPFQARFFTDGKGLMVVESRCGTAPILLNTQEGEGEATHLGRFSTVLTFCMDVTDIADGKLEGEESLPYDNGSGSLIAADGDALHIEIAGVVVPSDHPDFDFEFQDPFHFVGGTGRFAGATGGGTTESYVDRAAGRTHHEWRGVLVLPPGVSPR